jgi:hypothetical protein
MRKIGAIFGITALTALVFSPLPTAAFGIHVGPFYFHFPLVWHHRHHLYMRTNPNEARARRNEVNTARTEQTHREARTKSSTEVLESCPSIAPDVTNPSIDQIRKIVHPTADQEAALHEVSAASSQAGDVINVWDSEDGIVVSFVTSTGTVNVVMPATLAASPRPNSSAA